MRLASLIPTVSSLVLCGAACTVDRLEQQGRPCNASLPCGPDTTCGPAGRCVPWYLAVDSGPEVAVAEDLTEIPDQAAPDLAIKPDANLSGVGGPCPCKVPLHCILTACRKPCDVPTDVCKVSSNCPADQACIKATTNNFYCVPAEKPGADCGTGKFCPMNHICAATQQSKYRCLPTCTTKGAACGTGGTCVGTTCLFCSKP